MPSDTEVLEVSRACSSIPHFTLLWAVKVEEKKLEDGSTAKKLLPNGLALVSLKQMVLQAGQTHPLPM